MLFRSRVVSGAWDQSLKLWDVASGTCLATWTGHTGRVTSCAFSPDGTRVVSGANDQSLKLWDVASGTCLATWTGHTSGVTSCAFSPDGTQVVSGAGDRSLRLWDVASGALLRIHQCHGGGHAVWNASDQQLVDVSDDAWRWLAAQIYDSDDRLIDVLPAECLTTLPVRKTAPG